MTIGQITEAEGVIVDTRLKHAYMKRHLPGSLMAGFENDFNTTAGSYINADSDIFFVVDERNLEQAIRDFIRVGLDHIKGYVTVNDLDHWDGKIERIEAITFDEIDELKEKEKFQVLDVRKATEYAEVHVSNAINIAHTRLADHLDKLPRDKTLLVHCASGQRASYASSLLTKEGFKVKWVDDLFANWQNKHK